jgi:entericidin B
MTMKALAAFLAAAVLSLTAGCNTMEGAGKDVQAGGRAVERAADKANPTADPKKY